MWTIENGSWQIIFINDITDVCITLVLIGKTIIQFWTYSECKLIIRIQNNYLIQNIRNGEYLSQFRRVTASKVIRIRNVIFNKFRIGSSNRNWLPSIIDLTLPIELWFHLFKFQMIIISSLQWSWLSLIFNLLLNLTFNLLTCFLSMSIFILPILLILIILLQYSFV